MSCVNRNNTHIDGWSSDSDDKMEWKWEGERARMAGSETEAHGGRGENIAEPYLTMLFTSILFFVFVHV